MFDLDQFITECIGAAAESEPRLAVEEILQRALRRSAAVSETLPAARSEIVRCTCRTT